MTLALTIEDVTRDPGQLTAPLLTGDGDAFTARVLSAEDAGPLGRYFDGLGPSVRGVYGPHPLNSEHATALCAELDYSHLLPFVAVHDDNIIGYFLVQIGLRDGDRQRYIDHGHALVDAACCTFAPCVADAWQERGLGSALFPHVAQSLRRLRRQRLVLWGGVRGDNPRAQHFYRKFGFRHVGNFKVRDLDNLDMVLDL